MSLGAVANRRHPEVDRRRVVAVALTRRGSQRGGESERRGRLACPFDGKTGKEAALFRGAPGGVAAFRFVSAKVTRGRRPSWPAEKRARKIEDSSPPSFSTAAAAALPSSAELRDRGKRAEQRGKPPPASSRASSRPPRFMAEILPRPPSSFPAARRRSRWRVSVSDGGTPVGGRRSGAERAAATGLSPRRTKLGPLCACDFINMCHRLCPPLAPLSRRDIRRDH